MKKIETIIDSLCHNYLLQESITQEFIASCVLYARKLIPTITIEEEIGMKMIEVIQQKEKKMKQDKKIRRVSIFLTTVAICGGLWYFAKIHYLVALFIAVLYAIIDYIGYTKTIDATMEKKSQQVYRQHVSSEVMLLGKQLIEEVKRYER